MTQRTISVAGLAKLSGQSQSRLHGPHLALFDCDGTLVDSQEAIVGAMNVAFDARGLPPPPAEAVRRVVGLSLLEAVAALLPGLGRPEHEAVTSLYREAFAAQRAAGLHQDPLYPGAVAALDALADAGWLLGIATGKSMRGLLAILEGHGLRERFVTLQTPDSCRGKPDPHMVECAMAQTGAAASATVVIGDTIYDIGMARAAGAIGIGVGWGYLARENLLRDG
jgi:phosphoglycolate phosphatase